MEAKRAVNESKQNTTTKKEKRHRMDSGREKYQGWRWKNNGNAHRQLTRFLPVLNPCTEP